MFMAWLMLFSAVGCAGNMIYNWKTNREAAGAWFVAMMFAAALSMRHFAELG